MKVVVGSNEEISKHQNLAARKAYTDFFFEIMNKFQDFSIATISKTYGENFTTLVRYAKNTDDKITILATYTALLSINKYK